MGLVMKTLFSDLDNIGVRVGGGICTHIGLLFRQVPVCSDTPTLTMTEHYKLNIISRINNFFNMPKLTKSEAD